MRTGFVIAILAALVFSACSDSQVIEPGDLKPEIDTSKVIKELPIYLEVDFKTFNLAYWGSEKVESNRNWETYNDSVYLTVNRPTDSILIYDTHGIEELVFIQQHELSKRVKGADGTNLDLVDWEHEYSTPDTLPMVNFQFQPGSIPTGLSFKTTLNQDSLEHQILKIENRIGSTNWSSTKSEGYLIQDYVSRTFYRLKAQYNNGDSMEKIVIFHYAN